jgi:hypothetical protein
MSQASTKRMVDPRREILEEVGYSIRPDVDQPGKWVWVAVTDGCDASFDSEAEAYDDAYRDAASQVMSILDMADEQWDALTLYDQSRAIRSALTEDRPTFEPSAAAGNRRKFTLELSVMAPAGISGKDVAAIVDKLLNAGLGDAQATVENDEGDVAAAQAALDLDLSSPTVCREGT